MGKFLFRNSSSGHFAEVRIAQFQTLHAMRSSRRKWAWLWLRPIENRLRGVHDLEIRRHRKQ
jgi:hypothetical protein